jgi:hypothetical protein
MAFVFATGKRFLFDRNKIREDSGIFIGEGLDSGIDWNGAK